MAPTCVQDRVCGQDVVLLLNDWGCVWHPAVPACASRWQFKINFVARQGLLRGVVRLFVRKGCLAAS